MKSIKQIEKLLSRRPFYTPEELVKMGLYGGRSSVHSAIKRGDIEACWISERRIIIYGDSVIEHIKKVM